MKGGVDASKRIHFVVVLYCSIHIQSCNHLQSMENLGNNFEIESLVSVSSTAGSQGLKTPTEAWWFGRFQRL